MASKQKGVAPVTVSPVLFMTVDGEPMSFFLRPGPTKRNLQPLISAGGGMLCNIQQPGAILLINPEERSSIPESSAHWYVSTQYIHDCIEKEEQLNIEDYRLNPEVQKQSAKPNTSKISSPGLSGGRIPYTPEEDETILKYVSKHTAEIGGNRLWQEMEKQNLTSHSWQSMKYRYRVRLAKRLSEFVEVETTETEEMTEEEENEDTDVQNQSCEEDVSHSAETDLTQIDAQVLPSGSRADNADAPTSTSSVTEDQHVNQQAEEQPAENTQVETFEAEPSPSLQTEGACAELQTDTQLRTDETTEPERDGLLTTVSPQKQSLQEDSAPAQPSPSLKTPSSSKKTKGKQKATPEQNQSERRVTRRRLELEASSTPEPYGKKLRSSSTTPTPSPQSAKKTKSAVKSVPQKDVTTEQTPSKRARGKYVAAEEETQREQSGHATASETEDTQREDSGHASVSETTPADEPTSAPQKKKDKRQIGILELASKEFEDGSESDEDETPDLQNSAETAATSTKALTPPSDTAADPASSRSHPEPGPILQKDTPRTPRPGPAAAAAAAAAEPPVSEPPVSEPPVSKAHLFIFDSESQASQSIFGSAAPSNPQPTVNKATALSLTQVQLEEDKQRIRELMKQTKQDLVSVTTALLKTSGDFSVALDLLLNPSTVSGPFWNRHDDDLLLSDDPDVRQQLQEKYGEENVAKRIMFLEVEG